MKTVTFTYVRHGRTEFNRDHVIQGGRVDSPLDPAGLPSIHATAAALADLPFARCYASPLGRVLQTAAILVDGRDLPVRTLDDLREFDFGDIDGQAYPGRRITFARCFVRQDFSPVHGALALIPNRLFAFLASSLLPLALSTIPCAIDTLGKMPDFL